MKYSYLLLLLLLYILPFGIDARSSMRKKSNVLLSSAIHKLAHPGEQHIDAAIGLKIISLKNNQVIYEKNADQLFKPASNTKLFTAAAALEILGPDYRFETQLLTNTISSTPRIDNLYIKGGGDPTFKTANLEDMVIKLKNRGIREIRGNIVIDASIFDYVPAAPGWNKNDGPIFDKSPVGGLVINHSCLTVTVKPARIPGHKPIVSLNPALTSIKIENLARTSLTSKKHSLHVSRPPKSEKKITISGTISTKTKLSGHLIVLDNPHLYVANVLLVLLKKHKIHCKGNIILGETPAKAPILARHHSEPASSIVRHMLKTSDNLYADALFKAMGAVAYGGVGSWETGKQAVDEFLSQDVGIPRRNNFNGRQRPFS